MVSKCFSNVLRMNISHTFFLHLLNITHPSSPQLPPFSANLLLACVS